jgi:hypothetical protein
MQQRMPRPAGPGESVPNFADKVKVVPHGHVGPGSSAAGDPPTRSRSFASAPNAGPAPVRDLALPVWRHG